MRLSFLFFTALLVMQTRAQTSLPKNFKMGELILLDSTHLKGFIKENFRKEASMLFLDTVSGKKKRYQASELAGGIIDSNRFICLQGDFFDLIVEGDLCFLKKLSDASNIAVYVGLEPIYPYGTQGKPGDFLIYDKKNKQMTLVSEKNIKELAASLFKDYAPAISMAQKAYSEIPRLGEAVDLYNRRAIRK